MHGIITFDGIPLSVIDRDGETWLRGGQIGPTLGYTHDPDRAVRRLYERNAGEFSPTMTAVVTLDTAGGPQETRLFSLRGAYLLALLARTEVAKRFRAWVLDLIEAETRGRAARVAALEAQVAEARAVLILAHPRWQKIAHYRTRGFHFTAIARLMRLPADMVQDEMALMERAGCLPPAGPRPDYSATNGDAGEIAGA